MIFCIAEGSENRPFWIWDLPKVGKPRAGPKFGRLYFQTLHLCTTLKVFSSSIHCRVKASLGGPPGTSCPIKL